MVTAGCELLGGVWAGTEERVLHYSLLTTESYEKFSLPTYRERRSLLKMISGWSGTV